MTKNEFKQGDKVRIEIPGLSDIGVIISRDVNCYNVKCGENYHYGVSGEYLELTSVDRKTAFLTRLQSLLREFDVSICGGTERERDLVKLNFESDCIIYRNGDSHTYAHINADNIMDFDKEGV